MPLCLTLDVAADVTEQTYKHTSMYIHILTTRMSCTSDSDARWTLQVHVKHAKFWYSIRKQRAVDFINTSQEADISLKLN